MKKIIVILIILLIIAGIFLVVSNNYNLTKKSDSSQFIKSYTGWVSKVFTNAVNTVGYVVKMDWLPK